MPDKPVKESIEELLARLYALAHFVPEFPIDVLDLNQVTDEETMAMADADAFLERVTRRSKR